MQTYSDFAPTGFDPSGLGLPDRQNWIVAPVSQTRDSGPLDESNFATAIKWFEDVSPNGDDFEIHRFGHWGPGWFEIIIVRPDSPCTDEAESIETVLADYPVLDDSDLSEREHEAMRELWQDTYSLSCRIRHCAEAGDSIFAARQDDIAELPENTSEALRVYATE